MAVEDTCDAARYGRAVKAWHGEERFGWFAAHRAMVFVSLGTSRYGRRGMVCNGIVGFVVAEEVRSRGVGFSAVGQPRHGVAGSGPVGYGSKGDV